MVKSHQKLIWKCLKIVINSYCGDVKKNRENSTVLGQISQNSSIKSKKIDFFDEKKWPNALMASDQFLGFRSYHGDVCYDILRILFIIIHKFLKEIS